MADHHRDADAGCRDRQVGELEDLARLSAELRLFVGLVALPRPVHHEVVIGRALDCKGVHPLRSCTGDGLVRRHTDAHQPRFVVERLEHAGQRDRAAVRIRDDAVTSQRLERPLAVHLRHDERIAVDQAVRGRLVDADRAGGRGDGNELTAGRRADREEEQIDVAGTEGCGRRLFDEQLVVAERDAGARRARRRERAHVLVLTLGEQGQRDGADRTGRTDDSDPRALSHLVVF